MAKTFEYRVIDSFLSTEQHEKVRSLHEQLQYDLKHTDLFKFFQTQEISKLEELKFFINELEKAFEEVTDTKDCFYTIFASFYRKCDYLLCHDDRVDHRRYAFTYYLDDYKSGSLVLFNDTCDKEIEKIDVIGNRLVLFEVSDVSWHEVSFCESKGRRAITGWLNHKSINHNVNNSNLAESFSMPDVNLVDLDLEYDGTTVLKVPGIEYNFSYTTKTNIGPFYMRRVTELVLEDYFALSIPSYELVYIKAYDFEDLSYILLNDYTNYIEDEDGQIEFSLTMLQKVLYVVKRENRKYFIENGACKRFKMVHMIYREFKAL